MNGCKCTILKNTISGLLVFIFLSSLLVTFSFSRSLMTVLGTTTTNTTTLAQNETKTTLSNTAKLNSQGLALLKLGRYNESIAYFDKALVIYPNALYVLDAKGAALLDLGKYYESIPYFDKALAVNS